MKQSEQWLFFGDPKAIPFHFTRKKTKLPGHHAPMHPMPLAPKMRGIRHSWPFPESC